MKFYTFLIVLALMISMIFLFYLYDEDRKIKNTQMLSLPYLQYSEEIVKPTEIGVKTFNRKLAFNGYTIIKNNVYDMDGNKVLPNLEIPFIWLNPSLICTSNISALEKIENSTFIHHNIFFLSNGNIYGISKRSYAPNTDIFYDELVEFDSGGNEIGRWSSYEHRIEINSHIKTELELIEMNDKGQYGEKLFSFGNITKKSKVYDLYHVNSVSEIPKTGHIDNRFKEGNLIVSFRHLSLIFILDRNTKEIVWWWGPGEILHQHLPYMLENGNILIYDNGNEERPFTRVIEIDPVTKKIVWEYKDEITPVFYAENLGNAQRLPNGNTLITDGPKGRVFEITPEKEIVWDFYNPNQAEGHREKIYKAIRISYGDEACQIYKLIYKERAKR